MRALIKKSVPVVAVLVLMAGVSARAQAQVKPFKISGGGPAPEGIFLTPHTPGIHYATGQATELGRYSCVGMFQLLGYNSPTVATFSSAPYCVFTAANGDILTCTYGDVGNGADEPGIVTLTPVGDGSFTAVFVAEFNPVPALCTGRFAKVTGGSWIMVAKSAPFFLLATQTTPFNYTWEGEGELEFGKGK
jgi:hypothetical protein